MPRLLAIAEYITKTHAICMKCGQPANYTQRTFESEERVAVGGAGMYENAVPDLLRAPCRGTYSA